MGRSIPPLAAANVHDARPTGPVLGVVPDPREIIQEPRCRHVFEGRAIALLKVFVHFSMSPCTSWEELSQLSTVKLQGVQLQICGSIFLFSPKCAGHSATANMIHEEIKHKWIEVETMAPGAFLIGVCAPRALVWRTSRPLWQCRN